MEGVSPQIWQVLLEARKLCDWYAAGCVIEAEDVWDMLMGYTENEAVLRWMHDATKEEYQGFSRAWSAFPDGCLVGDGKASSLITAGDG